MSSVSPLRSPALGTAVSDLIRPCEAAPPRRSRLPAPPHPPPLAVALSGGGFRATLRRRWMVERFRAWEAARDGGQPPPTWGHRGVLFGLATSFEPAPDWVKADPQALDPGTVALVATSFDRFPRQRCEKLVPGWWLTGAPLATYHRGVLGTDLPVWRPLP